MVKGKKLKGAIEEVWGFEAILCVNTKHMSCSFMGPNLFSTFQIILVEYQLFSMGPHHFGQVQIIKISSEKF